TFGTMPALDNPRWERFALALFAGLDGKTRLERAQSTAYLLAYPNCKPGNSAESAASQLLRRIKPITDRVRELQAEQSAKIQKKIDLSKERIGRRLNLASEMAEQQQNPAAIVNSELGIGPAAMARWWAKGDYNIGIATGRVSGFFVVDVDGHDGEAALRSLE